MDLVGSDAPMHLRHWVREQLMIRMAEQQDTDTGATPALHSEFFSYERRRRRDQLVGRLTGRGAHRAR